MTAPVAPPRRGPQCPPTAALEGWVAGEPLPAGGEAHLEGCTDCAGYVAALQAEREAFVKRQPAQMFMRKVARRQEAQPARGYRWLAAVAVGLTAAVLAVISPSLLESGVRTKGGNPLHVFAKRPGSSTPVSVSSDTHLKTADELRFSYAAPTDGQLAILDLDGKGAAQVFVPYGGARSLAVRAGDDAFLPGSVVLDDTPGTEWVVAVFAPAAFDTAPLLEQLKRHAGRAEAPTVSCDGCTVSILRLVKEP